MTTYTLQIGFKWNETLATGDTLTFVFLKKGKKYPCNPNTKQYDFNEEDELIWEIFDLTEPAESASHRNRMLCKVEIKFTPSTPLLAEDYKPPNPAGTTTNLSKTCNNLPGSVSGKIYTYWTPPDAVFTFKHKGSYSFDVKLDISEKRRFSLDPEMLVGPGGG